MHVNQALSIIPKYISRTTCTKITAFTKYLMYCHIWYTFEQMNSFMSAPYEKKANLRDLIDATGLVISNWIQIVNFSARVTAKFDGWPRKTIGHFFYITSSFVHHFKTNWIYSPETLNSGRNWWYIIPCDLEIWWMTFENNRSPLLCYFKLCAAFRSHWWIQT